MFQPNFTFQEETPKILSESQTTLIKHLQQIPDFRCQAELQTRYPRPKQGNRGRKSLPLT